MVQMKIRPRSTFVCAVTPFAQDGSLHVEGVRSLVGRLGDAAVGTYLASASPGEGHALSLDETEQLYGVALEAMGGRASVRAMGVECRTAEQYLPLLQIAGSVGLDAIQLYSLDCGHGNAPTPMELERYFRTLLDQAPLPCVLSSHMYNGYLVPVDLVSRLIDDYPHLIGLNVTTTDLPYLVRLIQTVDNRADVHVGGPMQALTVLALGGQGFLSTDGNIVPRLCASVIDNFKSGNLDDLFAAYSLLMKVFSINVWPGGSMRWLKAAMRVTNQPGSYLRGPYIPLELEEQDQIRLSLQELNVVAVEGLELLEDPGT
ncbi:MAG TPA: dihydrodipicolinate synthase family protein [Trebonia sp.]